MKSYFTTVFLILSIKLMAQPYPEPDFVEKPNYYNSFSKESTELERQIGPYEIVSGSANRTLYFKNPKSPLRIKKEDGVQFLIKLVNPPELDLVLPLYHLTENKKYRSLLLYNRVIIDQRILPFTYKKVGENTYLLTVSNLQPGEYIWFLQKASYFFGVE
ncbi:MAG: hypothetical protein H7329_15540 [Opitutaceae bacterium]|nr:hypothetical protein [Cytophagales bacterium]